jgi:hypothetical protein
MKLQRSLAVLVALFATNLFAQEMPQNSAQHQPQHATSEPGLTTSKADSDDVEQLRADVQRLRVLLNQMRSNLAFVQTSQTPLKHQFELEADAWQVLIGQMDRRLKRMEENAGRAEPRH